MPPNYYAVVENTLASMLCIQSFLAHYKQQIISTINPAITENMKCSVIEAHTQYIDLKVVRHFVIVQHYILLPALRTLWLTFQARNSVRSAPASTVLAWVLHQSHNVCTMNRHLYSSGERNEAKRRALAEP